MEDWEELWLFIDLPILCIVLLIFYFSHFFKNKSALPQYKTIRYVIVGTILFTVMDVIFDLVEVGKVKIDYDYFYGFYLLYNILMCWISVKLFRFAQYTVGYKKGRVVLAMRTTIACIITLTFCTVCSRNSTYFVYEQNGLIQLGPCDTIWYAMEFLPIFWMFLLAFRRYYDKRYMLVHEKCASLLFCSCLFLLFGFLQFIFYKLPIFEISITFTIMYLNQVMDNALISVDELTGLKNRRELIKDVNEMLKNKNADWYLLIYDVDKFKNINDVYGHVEGDFALKMVAEVMKEATHGRNAQAYRFGGDEFVILKTVHRNESIHDFCDVIVRAMHEKNKVMNKDFNVFFSYGRVRVKDCKSKLLSDIIMAADEKMYEMKKNNKFEKIRKKLNLN